MKKLVFFSMMVAMVFFVSCDKDGVYNPAKKISKITYTSVSTNKDNGTSTTYINTQEWIWDKNQLKQIVHKSLDVDNPFTWTEDFTYASDGRLIRVEDKEGAMYTTYEYDGDRLDKVVEYYDNFRESEYHFKYEGGRLSEIECWEFDADYSIKKENRSNPLAFVCSPEIANLTQMVADNRAVATESQSRHKMDVYITTISLEWDGDNVSRMIYTYPLYNERYEYLLTYDNKVNPFARFFGLFFTEAYDDDYFYKNKNNNIAISEVGSTWKREYTYTYTGQYPETYTYVSDGYSLTYRHTYKIEYK